MTTPASAEPAATPSRQTTPTRPLLKVCGATTVDDVRLVASAGADLVGLWYGIPGGHADLPVADLVTLAAAAGVTGIRPVLVTFASDPAELSDVVSRTGVRWLQLHAYQPPAVVRAIRSAIPGELTIIKVLHVDGGKCVERPLIPAYERAGTDLFLLDAVGGQGRVGSTGQRLAAADVLGVVAAVDRPFLLAGGISATNRPDYDPVVGHPLYAGIDVDTAARDGRGRFDAAAITAIVRAWSTAQHHDLEESA